MRPPPRGREARAAPPSWNLCKTAVQTIGFWCFFLFLVPWLIISVEDQLPATWPRLPPSTFLGASIFAIFGSLGLASGFTMAVVGRGTPMPQDCPRHLVVAGPYRFVRNPMALAGLAQGAGVALWLGSVGVLLYVAAGTILWNFWVRRWEEADLSARFGPAYDHYRSAVRCWVPRVTPYVPPNPTSPRALPGDRDQPPGEC